MSSKKTKPAAKRDFNLAVIKLGSSVLTDISAISKAIHEIYQYLRNRDKVLVVVSAIGNTTNELVDSAKKLLDDPKAGPPAYLFAELLSTGETAAASLVTISLDRAGVKAKKLDHHCLTTRGAVLNADPHELDKNVILNLFKQYAVLVIPGFIGVDEENGVTTLLGRGGSDYTALFAAWALKAEKCVLYKDTDGIFDYDPNMFTSAARRYKAITFADCLALAAPVVQQKALAFAQEKKFPFEVKSFVKKQGTLVGAKKTTTCRAKQNINKLKVLLLGCGTVGLGVYKHLLANKHLFEVVGICVRNTENHQQHNLPAELISDNLEESLARECDIVVELIGGIVIPEKIITYALSQRRHVITANKALIAEKGLELSQLADQQGVKIFYSAAVAGSVPILENLYHFKKIKPDSDIQSVMGILNGTCNFVLDEIKAGKTFADAVELAKIMGYAESDPSFDINGNDAAQKIAIISRLAFGRDPDSLKIEGIQNLNEQRVRAELAKGKTVRLIASCKQENGIIEAEVKPIALPHTHPLAAVSEANNAVLIEKADGEIIELHGKGAGRWPTAEAVYADLLELSIQHQENSVQQKKTTINNPAQEKPLDRWTQLVHFDTNPGDPYHPNSTPIYQTATFAQQTLNIRAKYDYTRSGNPTRSVVEQQVAKLEQAQYGFAFASGMAAITAVIGLLKQGDHIIAGDDLYGGTYRLLSERLALRGVHFTLADTTSLTAVKQALTTKTRLLLIETPSNPLQKISNIKALAEVAHNNNALLVVDNTFLSPWLQQPLLLGADIVMHSATKHLAGHSDVTAGVLVTNTADLAEKIAFIQNCEGAALAPFECWLLLKGLKTLGLRIERQQNTAEKIVNYLCNHSAVKQVYYPTLANHPGADIHKRQANGGGTVISFETGSLALSKQLVEQTRLFVTSVSFGSLTSLINLPSNMSHASIAEEKRGFKSNLIRLSIGIEEAEDLIYDFERILVKGCKNERYSHNSD